MFPIIEYIDKIVALFFLINLFWISSTIGLDIAVSPLNEIIQTMLKIIFSVNIKINTNIKVDVIINFKVFVCPNLLVKLYVLLDNKEAKSVKAVINPKNLKSNPIFLKCIWDKFIVIP